MWVRVLKLYSRRIIGALPDPWWRKSPCIFRLAKNNDGRVSDFLVLARNTGSWNVYLCRRLNDWEIEEMRNLLGIIGPICQRPDKEDCLVWDFSKNGMFSVKLCREAKWAGMLLDVG